MQRVRISKSKENTLESCLLIYWFPVSQTTEYKVTNKSRYPGDNDGNLETMEVCRSPNPENKVTTVT